MNDKMMEWCDVLVKSIAEGKGNTNALNAFKYILNKVENNSIRDYAEIKAEMEEMLKKTLIKNGIDP